MTTQGTQGTEGTHHRQHRHRPPPLPLRPVLDEFYLTTVLLFLAVSVVRWLRYPTSPAFISSLHASLYVIGPIFGAIIIGLILSPWGRRSGGHLNPAITVALWLMDVFPGKSVVPYVTAQLAGSVLGAAVARGVWGTPVSSQAVIYGAVRSDPSWVAADVFLAESFAVTGVMVMTGGFLAHPRHSNLLPYAIGAYIAASIAFLGPYSGGSINPARQFGPALLGLNLHYLWIYLLAPMLGAVLGAALHHLLARRFDTHEPLTYKLQGHQQH